MRPCVSLLALVTLASSPNIWGATIDVDGSTVKTLSAAVTAAQNQDDGPHVINIKVDSLPTPDSDFIIQEPITINGDADGNGQKCDILVDVATMQGQEVPGKGELLGKSYIKINTAGAVTINDLKIHPNADGSKSSADSELVDAIRVFCAPQPNEKGDYVLNRVWISGSDGNNGDKFVSLETTEDIFGKAGLKLWSRQATMGNRGIIHCGNRKQPKGSLERGEYQLTLNDCQVGLGRGVALNFTASSGSHVVNGGIYGHCGGDAIRVAGNTLSLTGSPKNWLRLIRGGSSSTGNGLISFTPKAQADKIEYVYLMPVPGAKSDLDSIISPGLSATKKEVQVVTDPVEMATAIKGISLPTPEPFKGWLAPEAAWAQAQSKKQNMVLLFYSPAVPLAVELNKLMETDRSATSFLQKNSAARINVTEAAGQKIAQQYGIYKIPALLIVASDAKSFQRVLPTTAKSWKPIEAELVKK